MITFSFTCYSTHRFITIDSDNMGVVRCFIHMVFQNHNTICSNRLVNIAHFRLMVVHSELNVSVTTCLIHVICYVKYLNYTLRSCFLTFLCILSQLLSYIYYTGKQHAYFQLPQKETKAVQMSNNSL